MYKIKKEKKKKDDNHFMYMMYLYSLVISVHKICNYWLISLKMVMIHDYFIFEVFRTNEGHFLLENEPTQLSTPWN